MNKTTPSVFDVLLRSAAAPQKAGCDCQQRGSSQQGTLPDIREMKEQIQKMSSVLEGLMPYANAASPEAREAISQAIALAKRAVG